MDESEQNTRTERRLPWVPCSPERKATTRPSGRRIRGREGHRMHSTDPRFAKADRAGVRSEEERVTACTPTICQRAMAGYHEAGSRCRSPTQLTLVCPCRPGRCMPTPASSPGPGPDTAVVECIIGLKRCPQEGTSAVRGRSLPRASMAHCQGLVVCGEEGNREGGEGEYAGWSTSVCMCVAWSTTKHHGRGGEED